MQAQSGYSHNPVYFKTVFTLLCNTSAAWRRLCENNGTTRRTCEEEKVKEVDLYSAFIVVRHTQGAQVRMTQCYLRITPYLPLQWTVKSVIYKTSRCLFLVSASSLHVMQREYDAEWPKPLHF